ncbi:hypothetical protein [Sutterella wadsworthensis]|uniref:hypothetical protein n=1 Tax=Sutterella wadsworthensis TaxID=40545 RepID=UPI003A8DA791
MDDDIKGRRFFELARRLAKARRPPKLIGTEAPQDAARRLKSTKETAGSSAPSPLWELYSG